MSETAIPSSSRPATARRGSILGTILLLVLAVVDPFAPVLAQDVELESLERQAEERFAVDDLDGARKLYRELAEKLTDDAEKGRILLLVAWTEHLAGEGLSTVVETLSDALALDPSLELAPELYSESFRRLGPQAMERAEIKRTIRANELVRRGFEDLRGNDLPAARTAFESALGLAPNQPQALFNLALVDLRVDRLDDAATGFERILALAELEPEAFSSELRGRALINLGVIFNRREMSADAAGMLERGLELLPEDADAWIHLGIAHRGQGDTAAALEAFRRAQALAPDHPQIAGHLAATRAQAERPPPDVTPKAPAPPPPSSPRPRLGLRFADIDYAALGISGVMVDAVVPGTAASRAGLLPNDLLLKIDGRPIPSPEALEDHLEATDTRVFVVELLRDNRPRKIELRFD